MIKAVFFILCFVIVDSLYEGEYCIHTKSNTAGSCIPIARCKRVVDDLRQRGIPPQTCGFIEGDVALACCPGIISSTSSGITTTSTTTSTTNSYDDDVKECAYPNEAITVNENDHPSKAWKKCIELADAVFPCKQRSFYLGAVKTRVSECQHEAAELIIGGTPAKPNEFPHMAALGYVNNEDNTILWDCGGTLISEQWIMSAAHCLYNRRLNANVSKACLGEHNLTIPADPRNLFEIIERVKHPQYIGSRVYNDITLLKIDRPVKYSSSILPACLHVGNNVKDDKAVATGYGLTAVDVNSKSDELLKVTVDKFTKEECSAKNPRQRKSPNGVIDTQICYGSRYESKDTCQGDSGGPLQIYNLGVHCTYTVIGITSVGKLCGTPGFPAIYTRVSEYVPWIESVVWPN